MHYYAIAARMLMLIIARAKELAHASGGGAPKSHDFTVMAAYRPRYSRSWLRLFTFTLLVGYKCNFEVYVAAKNLACEMSYHSKTRWERRSNCFGEH